MITKKTKVLMADLSHIYYDYRIQKEMLTLIKNKYEVTTIGLRDKFKKENIDNLKIITFYTFSRKFRLLRNISLFFNILIINFIIIFIKADYYHSHNTFFLIGLYISSKLHNGKLIYDSHEIQWEHSRISGLLEKIFIGKCDSIVNVNVGRANAQLERYKNIFTKINILPNYPLIYEKKRISSKTFDGKVKYIFSGGYNLLDNKIDSFIDCLKEFPECELSIMGFGYGDSEIRLRKFIENQKIENQIKFLPMVRPNEVIDAILHYDYAINMLVNPLDEVYLRYPAVNKMYEYLAAGLFLISSNLEQFRIDFKDIEGNIIVDPNDYGSIKMGIRESIDNIKNMRYSKEKIIEKSYNEFNWLKYENNLLNAYKFE
jgi:glycosyltransferase involved in cell wall biosynthesis